MRATHTLLGSALDRIREMIEKIIESVNDNPQPGDSNGPVNSETESNIPEDIPPETPYNLVQHPSSHNSYNPATHSLDISEQFSEHGIHSFELDIHSGDPGLNLVPFLDGDHRPENDYYVYHFTGDSGSHYQYLSDGLNEIYNLDNSLPVTLFVDLKNSPFEHEGQGVESFEELLTQQLGDKLFTPQDMIDRVPGATTLQEAIDQGGWPSVEELDGKVLVVLTGSDEELFEYAGEGIEANTNNAFIAPSPQISVTPEWIIELDNGEYDIGPDQIEFDPSPEAIFYNMNEGNSHNAGIVHDNGYVSRVYGFDDLGESAQNTDANHLGTDHIDPENNEWNESGEDGPVNIIDPPEIPKEEQPDGPII